MTPRPILPKVPFNVDNVLCDRLRNIYSNNTFVKGNVANHSSASVRFEFSNQAIRVGRLTFISKLYVGKTKTKGVLYAFRKPTFRGRSAGRDFPSDLVTTRAPRARRTGRADTMYAVASVCVHRTRAYVRGAVEFGCDEYSQRTGAEDVQNT